MRIRPPVLLLVLAAVLAFASGAGGSRAASGESCRWRPAPVDDPHPHLFDRFNSVAATASGKAWAVGDYYTGREGGPNGAFIEEWTGRRWRLVGTPLPNTSFWSVSASGRDDAWAVGFRQGHRVIEHWNGRAWSRAVPARVRGHSVLHAVATGGSRDAWLVGSQWRGAWYRADTLIEHWDGKRWSIVPSPSPRTSGRPDDAILQAVSIRSRSDAWAVGYSIVGYGRGAAARRHEPVARTLVEHWNGERWQIVPSPSVRAANGVLDDILFSVSVDRSGEAWAVGSWGSGHFIGYGGRGDHALVLHWNGRRWSRAGLPLMSERSLMSGVGTQDGRAWAVGDHGEQPRQRPLIERWDGTRWTVAPSPRGFGLAAVSVPAHGRSWAVGAAGRSPLAARLVCGG